MYKICEREEVLFLESQSSGVFILVTSSTMRLNGDKEPWFLATLPSKDKGSKDNDNLKGKLKHTYCKQSLF